MDGHGGALPEKSLIWVTSPIYRERKLANSAFEIA